MSSDTKIELEFDKRYGDVELIKRFFKYLAPYIFKLVLIVIGILSIAVLTVFPPTMVQKAFDLLEASSKWQAVFPYALGYVLLLVGIWILQVIIAIIVVKLTQQIIKQIQMDTYISLQEHDLAFFDKQSTGQIMSRITNDTQELSNMLNIIAQFISNALVLVTVVVWMFIVNWRLTLITMCMAPFVLIVALVFRQITRMTTGNWRAAIGEVNAAFQESVSGIAVAKAFRREKRSKEEFKVINELTYKYAKKRAFAIMGIWPLMDGISVLGVFAITFYGSSLIFKGLASASTILLFLLLLNRFLYPLLRVASQFSTIQSGFAAMDRIFSIIDAKKAIVNPPNPVKKNIKGDICFDHVWFEYKKDVPVLKDINLEIRSPEKIAIVGHTGAGKTTMAS
ncbi:MAG: ABC transporter ATP-binding protein, partial [Candidatus Heimdallarchaeaceae archaeon]